MTKTMIRIGHSAYQGANKIRLCFSKAQAVRVLCNRGVKRDVAREIVSDVLTRCDRYLTITGEYSTTIEICNEQAALERGHYFRTYEENRKLWAGISEL